MDLTTSSIAEHTTVTAPKALLKEWLAYYFDGTVHDVSNGTGTQSVLFPKAYLAWDQGIISAQPLDSSALTSPLEIRMVIDPVSRQIHGSEGGDLVQEDVAINLFIRAKQKASSGAGDSNYLANQTCNLLMAILSNPLQRHELASRGIMTVRPSTPRTIEDNDYAMRHIRCRAQFQYLVAYTSL